MKDEKEAMVLPINQIIHYKCFFVSGGGAEYDGGVWEFKETKTAYILTLTDEPFFDLDFKELVLKKDKSKNKHPYQIFEDGDITVYPFQCGTPHLFIRIPTNTKAELI